MVTHYNKNNKNYCSVKNGVTTPIFEVATCKNCIKKKIEEDEKKDLS